MAESDRYLRYLEFEAHPRREKNAFFALNFGFNLTQARAADDELWCVYDPVFDLFLPCELAA